MNKNKLKKAASWLLVLVMVICMLPSMALTSSATGYDNGYSGGMAGVGYTVARGLDLSVWQDGINFSSIKSAGYDYVILRCGYSGTKDRCFETFYSQAKAVGLDVGVYFYSYATSAAGALQDAKECVSYLAGKQFEYPIYYDVEDPNYQGSLSTSTLQSICLTFMDYLAGQGYLTGLYASESWITSKIYASQICTKYECWIAKYYYDYSENHNNGFSSKYGMWQYTSKCPVAGYNVDADLCYKDYPAIVKNYGFNGYGASGSTKLTDPVVFNEAYYRNTYPDLASMTDDQLKQHWLDYGVNEGRCASPAFDVKWYLANNADVANAFGSTNYKSAIYHFIDHGIKEGRPGSANFYNFNYYKANSQDLRAAFGYDNYSYYKHFVDWGYYDDHPVDREANLIDGVYKFYSAKDTNYAMNIAGNSTEDGGNLQLWDSDTAHAFVVQSSPDGYYYIRALYSNKYLDVYGNGTENGTNVSQYGGNGTDAQKWSIEKNADGTYSFYALASGKALDVKNGTMANGQNIQIWEENGTEAQKWVAVAQPTVNDGVYSVASATATGQTLHVNGGATMEAASLTIWEREDVMWEKLAVEYVGDGYYTLRMLSSNLYMDVTGAQSSDGTDVGLYAYNGSDAQLWRIVPNNDGSSYNIVSKLRAMHLDRSGGSDANGTNVQIWNPNRGGAQKWLMNPTTVGLDGIWNIAASGNESFLLDIAQASTEQGANLEITTASGSDSQKFIVQSINDQYYVIRALHSGRLLNISGGEKADGTEVLQWSSEDIPAENERWQIIPNADGTYSFVGVCNGLYLNLSNNQLADGTNVQMWSHNASVAAQRWSLTNRYAVVADGTYTLLSSGDPTYALDIDSPDEETAQADGANAQIWGAVADATNQEFYLKHEGNGYYSITNMRSEKVLDVADGSKVSGTNVQQNTANGSDAQLWSILPNNDGTYTFVSKCGGKSLDIKGGVYENGRNVQVYQGNATNAQKWVLSLLTHSHTAGNVLERVPATCTTRGYTVYVCASCGETFISDYVDQLEHTVVIDAAVTPGCETTGLTEGSHCAVCDTVLVAQEVIAATGHTVVAGETVPPTCTTRGYTTYVCKYCETNFQADDWVAATGHSEVIDEAVPATCAEDGLTEGIHCSVCDAIIIAQKVVPAIGHSYTYTDNGNGTHTATCANCGDIFMEDHTFTDGTCVCGAAESTEPTVDGAISIGQQLSLESDLSLTFRIKESQLTAYDVSTAYLVVERDIYPTGGEMYVKTDMLTEYTIENSRLAFVYSGISAAQMNDEIRVTLHIKDGSGKDYVSNTLMTSVTAYAKLLLDAYGTTNAKLCTVLMDMLNYGTAAQIYFDRHADAPANTAYAEFANYASYASAEFATPLENLSSMIANEGATATMNLSVELATQIGIVYKATLPSGVNAADATVVVKDADGNELETLSLADGTVDSKGRYVVTYFGTPSRLMRRVVYGTVYVGDTAISNTYGYSISTYAYQIANTAGMPEALVNLTNLMVMYGDAANAYFGG